MGLGSYRWLTLFIVDQVRRRRLGKMLTGGMRRDLRERNGNGSDCMSVLCRRDDESEANGIETQIQKNNQSWIHTRISTTY